LPVGGEARAIRTLSDRKQDAIDGLLERGRPANGAMIGSRTKGVGRIRQGR